MAHVGDIRREIIVTVYNAAVLIEEKDWSVKGEDRMMFSSRERVLRYRAIEVEKDVEMIWDGETWMHYESVRRIKILHDHGELVIEANDKTNIDIRYKLG